MGNAATTEPVSTGPATVLTAGSGQTAHSRAIRIAITIASSAPATARSSVSSSLFRPQRRLVRRQTTRPCVRLILLRQRLGMSARTSARVIHDAHLFGQERKNERSSIVPGTDVTPCPQNSTNTPACRKGPCCNSSEPILLASGAPQKEKGGGISGTLIMWALLDFLAW